MSSSSSSLLSPKGKYVLLPYENGIDFIEDTHKYILRKDESLLFKSVTEILTDYFFDKFTGEHVTRKNDFEEMAMIARWVSAAYFGTTIHYYLEKYMTDFENAEVTDIRKWYDDILNIGSGYNLMINGVIDKNNGDTNGPAKEKKNFSLLRNRLVRDCSKHLEKRQHLNLDDTVEQALFIFNTRMWYDLIRKTLKAFVNFITNPQNNCKIYCGASTSSDHPNYTMQKRILQLFESPLNIISSEYIVYDCKWLIAGTIDLLLWTNFHERRIAVVDWKTNQLDLCASKYKIKTNIKSPFYGKYLNLWDKYKCQLHIYSIILERNYNVSVEYIIVVHILKDGVKIYAEPFHSTCCECILHLSKIKNNKV